MNKSFWKQLTKPIIGLSPMDGVTDAPYRIMMARYGKPDIMFTEFVSVEGLSAGATRIMKSLIYTPEERPIIGQLFGSDPLAFYKAAIILCTLGFDGIDINMGCPAPNIASKGAGASLIKTPELARKIIKNVKLGILDWSEGITLEKAEIPADIIDHIKKVQREKIAEREKKAIPVSIKTRIGYTSKKEMMAWIKHLITTNPDAISLHGRTYKQGYRGLADWEAIGAAAAEIHTAGITIMGNGDLKTLSEARQKTADYGVDGVLIGRATFGNPWFFSGKVPSISDRLKAAIEHCLIYEQLMGNNYFMPMRKHLAWYIRGFPGAAELRAELMKTDSAREAINICSGAADLQNRVSM